MPGRDRETNKFTHECHADSKIMKCIFSIVLKWTFEDIQHVMQTIFLSLPICLDCLNVKTKIF